MHQRASTTSSASARSRWRARVPQVLAWGVRVAAVLPLLEALTSPDAPRGRAVDLVADLVTFFVAVLASAAMLFLAGALGDRRRRAWTLMVGVVAVSALVHARAGHAVTLAVDVAVLTALLWTRRDFVVVSERRGRLAAVRVLLVMAPLSLVAGLLIVRRTAPEESFGRRFVEVLAGLVGFAPGLRFDRPEAATFTQVALGGLGAATALLTLAALLAPVRRRPGLGPQDEERVRALLAARCDQDSLGYFALRDDKSVVFSASGKAAVAYRVVGGVTLAAGDPLGDREAWPGAIAAWLADAERYAWTPGVVGASEDGAVVYARCGFDALELGDEAVLDLATFTLEGRAMRTVRQAVGRAERAGYTVDVSRQRDVDPVHLGVAARVADALRGEEVERGFSMALGRVGDPRDGDVVLVRVRDGGGRLVAVLTFVPWGRDGLSLDVMRRARDSENGTVELALAGLVGAAPRLGVRRISLNFAVFRSVLERGTRVGAGPVTRLWRRTLLLGSRWWQIESLYRANAKYHPDWYPRFVCFRQARDLPHVVVATLEAEAFIQRPSLGWLAR